VPTYNIVIPAATVKNLDQLKMGKTKKIIFSSGTGIMKESFRIVLYPSAV
jgi:hypothetical protein